MSWRGKPERVQTLRGAAAIAVGFNALLIIGLFAPLLGALADEHRLSAPQIGLAATVELLAMAIAAGTAGARLPPRRLRTIGVAASLALAAADLAMSGAAGMQVLALRAMAGAAEGLLLWIVIGMIARTQTPERWAAVLFTGVTAIQLAVAFAYAVVVIPRFGASGGYAVLAVCAIAGVAPALALPSRYEPLPVALGQSGLPPRRGWIALAATLIFTSANGAVAVYLQRFALQAGLSADVARTAVWVALAAQVCGSAAATALAGKVRWLPVFALGTVVWLAVWTCLSLRVPAEVFIAANALSGLVALFVSPFYVPLAIEADPSRRAAMQTGAAQLLGAAAGPLMAYRLVSEQDAHKVLVLGGGLLLTGLAVMAWLQATAKRDSAVEMSGKVVPPG
ncbi:MAG: MFS transporter [Ignavibacteriales bacterium]